MKPNDDNGHLPPAERPFRILIISGSNRRQYNCPGVDSKARTLMLRTAERLPNEWEIDYEDLGNVYGRARIQSCNACVSTSMALCVWPCNCHEKGSKKEPDLMWELEHTPEWEALSVNHLEGRTAGFFCYGDGGGDELDSEGRPKLLKHAHKHYFDPKKEPFENDRDSYAPLVWQCRYGGVEVPDELWHYVEFGKDEKYSDNQAEDLPRHATALTELEAWTDRFATFVRQKGKVEPGKYRAFGYKAPGHFMRDVKLAWRDVRMRLGHPPEGSSPDE